MVQQDLTNCLRLTHLFKLWLHIQLFREKCMRLIKQILFIGLFFCEVAYNTSISRAINILFKLLK